MSLSFDLICVGSGPAAATVAVTCAKAGWNVAIVESQDFGGTCALHGCNPKKVFTNAAALFDRFQRSQEKLTRGKARIEWSDLVAFQHEFTDPVREKSEEKFEQRGIKTFHGVARFVGERIIEVGEQRLEARRIFLGVGARPTPLKIIGNELAITSDDFMELAELPARVLFLGGGFISFEFAHLAARVGSQVTISDRHELPLRSFDPDLVRLLMKSSQEAGIDIRNETEARQIERSANGLRVTLTTKTGDKLIDVDLVVNSGGRVPDLAGLNLEAGSIAHGKRGVQVNEFLQSTTNPAVYAGGDCADTGVQMLAPTANESARIAAKNLLAGEPATAVDYGPVPQVVFSVPPLAAVGMSEADARNKGLEIDIRYEDLSTKGEVRKLCSSTAGCKLIIDRRSDRILGAHLLGPHADEVINVFALAIRQKLTAAELKSMLFTYPTMTAEYCRLL
ncbi:dihydrolipoyl dehydrogenase family protein [Anatilimnocola floriformis]|uniref:dihydrolipoyl dehydrogenase family protein n=1 Tax=Anatilimnocola floriformis TaxID=2948575 RepID=UPI0020C39B6F|nr:NAD(P)/FAD-dependent oxidoreductase [Anatilimnocola floriformis]